MSASGKAPKSRKRRMLRGLASVVTVALTMAVLAFVTLGFGQQGSATTSDYQFADSAVPCPQPSTPVSSNPDNPDCQSSSPLSVDSGPDQTVYIAGGPIQPNTANLQGTVSGGDPPVINTWQTTSTPGNAGAPTIASTDSPATTAQFYAPGTYTETLSAVDSDGNSAKSSMTVTVCPDVELITAQGILNGGEDIFDNFFRSFKQAYSARFGLPKSTVAVTQQSITDWTSLTFLELAGDIVNAYYAGHLDDTDGRLHTEERFTPNYYANAQEGIGALEYTVSQEQKACPKTKIVLVGYSEGSDVVLQYLQGNPANIAAAYIYGSPRFNPDEAGRNSTGSAGTGGSLRVVDSHQGLMGALSYPSAVKLSTCHAQDLICQGLAIPKFCLEFSSALPPPVVAGCGLAITESVTLGILPHGVLPFLGYASDATIDGGKAAQNLPLS